MLRFVVRWALLVAVLAAAAWLALGAGIDTSSIEAAVRDLGIFAPVMFVALFMLGTIAFIPGALFGLASGVLFGPAWGTVWNLVGGTLGATLAFLLARFMGGAWVAARAGERLRTILEGVESEGWRFIALTRLVPLVPFNLLNYALGLTRISLIQYVAATAVCMLPGAAAYAWLGYAGKAATEGDAAAIRYAALGLAALALVAFLPRLIRRLRKPASVGYLEAEELERRLHTAGAPAVIDVRERDEYEGELGHIPGSLNVPLAELPAQFERLRENGRSVVMVCRTDKRSMKAATALLAHGVRDITVLRGGMEAWVEGNRPSIDPALVR